MQECKWDKKTKILTTPDDEENAKAQALEEAAWYKDKFAAHTSGKGTSGGKKQFAAPEMLYDLDGAHSVQTLHEWPGKGYADMPGAATINLGDKFREKEVVNV